MSITSDIANNAGKDLPQIELGAVIVRSTEKDSSQQFSSLPAASLMGAGSALPSAAVGSEVQALLVRQISAESYQQARTYALRDGKISFQYHFYGRSGALQTIVFERGLYVTANIEECTNLDADIRRNGGIGHTVMDITARELSQTLSIVERVAAAKGGVRGLMNSDELNVTKKRYEDQLRAQAEENRILRGQNEELRVKAYSPELVAETASLKPVPATTMFSASVA